MTGLDFSVLYSAGWRIILSYLEFCLELFSYGRLSFLLVQFQPVTSLSFFIINFLVWISPTPTTRTKIFIDDPVDGAWFKLSGSMSSGRSVALQPNSGFPVFTCFIANTSTCWIFCTSFSSVSSIIGRINRIVWGLGYFYQTKYDIFELKNFFQII